MGKTKTPRSKSDIIVGQGDKQAQGLVARLTSPRFLAMSGLVALLLIVIVFAVTQVSRKSAVVPPISQQQFAQRESTRVAGLLDDPAASQEDKQVYLQTLVRTEFEAGRYAVARDRYEQLLKLLGDRELSNDSGYLLGAAVYNQLGDKKLASEQVDKAEVVDTKIADPMMREEALAEIKRIRSELQL